MLQQEVVPLCYHTFEAKDGTEAFRILSEYSAIDLLFSDVLLPGPRNGYQLAKEARKHHPVLKVLFCSGYPRQPA